MIFTFFSCTYDYFVDENNLRLYVPQIKEGTISNFYVAFHDAQTGKHVLTRKLEAPFAKDEFTREGILRFKLTPGEYDITCFAEYPSLSVTEGNDLDNSYKYKFIRDKSDWLYNYGDDVYDSYTTDSRTVMITATAHPLGHPGGKDPVEINIDDSKRFKGQVAVDFIDLPSNIARIDILYKGLATRLRFDGTFNRFHNDDRTMTAYKDLAIYKTGNTISLPYNIVGPSAGLYVDQTSVRRPSVLPPAPNPLELEIRFFDAGGSEVGNLLFTKDDFDALPANKKPTDENGAPLTSLVLESRDKIKFVFKEFLVFNIELVGWGDTEEGEVTPM